MEKIILSQSIETSCRFTQGELSAHVRFTQNTDPADGATPLHHVNGSVFAGAESIASFSRTGEGELHVTTDASRRSDFNYEAICAFIEAICAEKC